MWRREDVSPLGFLPSFLLSLLLAAVYDVFLVSLTHSGHNKGIHSKTLLIMCPPPPRGKAGPRSMIEPEGMKPARQHGAAGEGVRWAAGAF